MVKMPVVVSVGVTASTTGIGFHIDAVAVEVAVVCAALVARTVIVPAGITAGGV